MRPFVFFVFSKSESTSLGRNECPTKNRSMWNKRIPCRDPPLVSLRSRPHTSVSTRAVVAESYGTDTLANGFNQLTSGVPPCDVVVTERVAVTHGPLAPSHLTRSPGFACPSRVGRALDPRSNELSNLEAHERR